MNNKLNKQTQEQQHMAANDERTRHIITARKNKLRNQEKEQDSPDRAKPKAKSDPKPIPTPPVNDAPQTTHMLRNL